MAQDFDGDGTAEIAVVYHGGAHTHFLSIYQLDAWGMLRLVPGGEIASDAADIAWEDRDGDGKLEVYATNQGEWVEGGRVFIDERLVWTGTGYRKEEERREVVRS